MTNHVRAGDEPEGLAQNLASSKFCDIGRRRTLARDGRAASAARTGCALVSPATQRNVVRVDRNNHDGTNVTA